MSEKKISKMSRKIEIFSLTFSVLVWPALFMGIGIWGILLLYKDPTIPRIQYLSVLMSLLLGIIFDTRIFAGGIVFVRPLQNYIHNREARNDVVIARTSILSIFFVFLLFWLFLR